jgi:hypothetical protein
MQDRTTQLRFPYLLLFLELLFYSTSFPLRLDDCSSYLQRLYTGNVISVAVVRYNNASKAFAFSHPTFWLRKVVDIGLI